MASISSYSGGKKQIQFCCGGKRRSIRVGKMNRRQAEEIRTRVEELLAAGLSGLVPSDTAAFLIDCPDALHCKLVQVGLAQPRQSANLKNFIETYIHGRANLKKSSVTVLGHAKRNLIEYFGEDKLLRDITSGDADLWRENLVKFKLAEATIGKRCRVAKQFFNAALRQKLIGSNPFKDLKAAIRSNPKRVHFITKDDATRIFAACPDAQWRLIFALSRYGGFRCPSEHLALTWENINWSDNKMTVLSPKTEHHEGKESRIVPIFPEILPYLREVFEQANPGTLHVITRYRDSTQNLRTLFAKIIQRAGLKPWPKLFHNLRASRQTELAGNFPSHVICGWIGNSEAVAREHYLQITEDHFKKALLHNPVQYPAELGGSKGKSENTPGENHTGFPVDTASCNTVQDAVMDRKGLEPLTPTLQTW